MQQAKKLHITLVMIVKNEAANIAKVIASCADAISSFCILDTGSTDGTQEIILRTAEQFLLPGTVHEEPFVDFSTSRNRVIELGQIMFPNTWQLMLSGDEYVQNAQTLWHELDYWSMRSTFNAFHITMQSGGLQWMSSRLFRPEVGWRYTGSYHEILTPVDGCRSGPVFTGCSILYTGTEDKRASWSRGLDLLYKDMQKDPTDGRPVFYRAQVYECLGMFPEAYRHYVMRTKLAGYVEERAMSNLYAGRIARELKELPSVYIRHWMDAFEICPHCAEPLYELANHYYHSEKPEHAYLYAREAYRRPVPPEALFVELPIYQWMAADLVGILAYYRHDFELGEAAARQAVLHQPADERLRNNLTHYENRKKKP